MFNRKLVLLLLCFSLFGCMDSKQSDGEGSSLVGFSNSSQVGSSSVEPLYPVHGGNLRLGLTDAPNKDVKEVWVNIDRIEIKAGPSSFILAQNIGMVDLLTLQNGKVMDLGEVIIPNGIKVTQARLILNNDNNHLIYKNGNRCDLQTPSQQNSGLKIIAPQFEIREGQVYSMIIDFDAQKSLVFKGNGGCLLKPVLKWGALTSVPTEDVDPDGSSDSDEEDDLTDGQEPPSDSTDAGTDDTTDDTTDDSTDTGTDDTTDDTTDDSTDTGTDDTTDDTTDDSTDTGTDDTTDDTTDDSTDTGTDDTTDDTTDDSTDTGTDDTTDDTTDDSTDTGTDDTTDDTTDDSTDAGTDDTTTSGGENPTPDDEMAMCQNYLGFDLYDQSQWPSDFDQSKYEHCF